MRVIQERGGLIDVQMIKHVDKGNMRKKKEREIKFTMETVAILYED
jgi:hypothetical protein